MRKPHIITIAGAGSARVPALVGTLVQYKERFPVSKMIFYDIDGERMGKMEAYGTCFWLKEKRRIRVPDPCRNGHSPVKWQRL